MFICVRHQQDFARKKIKVSLTACELDVLPAGPAYLRQW